MKFRYARHTTNLLQLEKFYIEVIGLQKLGGFENHAQYDGIFLGLPNVGWHLEFTTSPDKPLSKFDDDDALVFYVHSKMELNAIKRKLATKNIQLEKPKNPYWVENGIMISDPDKFKIIFSIDHQSITSTDTLSSLAVANGIKTWSEALEFIRDIPYGRNQNREDFSLVLKERKGTCSSKHAFLKKLAELNHIENVKLMIGMYKMNNINTPKIGNVISEVGLDYIPEAHCYLKVNNIRIDVTTAHADIENLANDLIEEIEIEADQVNIFKIAYHKKYIQKWIDDYNIDFDFNKVWELREKCIANLASNEF